MGVWMHGKDEEGTQHSDGLTVIVKSWLVSSLNKFIVLDSQ